METFFDKTTSAFYRHKTDISLSALAQSIRGHGKTTTEECFVVQACIEIVDDVQSYGGITIKTKAISDAERFVSVFFDTAIVVILKQREGSITIHYLRQDGEEWKRELFALANAHAKLNPEVNGNPSWGQIKGNKASGCRGAARREKNKNGG